MTHRCRHLTQNYTCSEASVPHPLQTALYGQFLHKTYRNPAKGTAYRFPPYGFILEMLFEHNTSRFKALNMCFRYFGSSHALYFWYSSNMWLHSSDVLCLQLVVSAHCVLGVALPFCDSSHRTPGNQTNGRGYECAILHDCGDALVYNFY